MVGKVILGGVLGGLAMFLMSSVTHMATPLGEVGVRSMPAAQEPAVVGHQPAQPVDVRPLARAGDGAPHDQAEAHDDHGVVDPQELREVARVREELLARRRDGELGHGQGPRPGDAELERPVHPQGLHPDRG